MKAVMGAYAAPKRGEFVVVSLQRLQRTALWAAFVFVALHWLWEDAHGPLDISTTSGGGGSGGGGGTAVCPSEAATLGDAWGLARRWAGHMFTGTAGAAGGLPPRHAPHMLHFYMSCAALSVRRAGECQSGVC